MSLSLFRKPKMQARARQRGPHGPQPKPAANRGRGPADPAAVVQLASEMNMPRMADHLIRSRLTLEQCKALLTDARDIRDACAAAELPHLADQLIPRIYEPGGAAECIRHLQAAVPAPSAEVSHHHPPEESEGGHPMAGAWSQARADQVHGHVVRDGHGKV